MPRQSEGKTLEGFGKRLLRVRDEYLHLDGEDFGALFGAGNSFVSKLEHGKKNMSVHSLAQMALNVPTIDYYWLLTGKPGLLNQLCELYLPEDLEFLAMLSEGQARRAMQKMRDEFKPKRKNVLRLVVPEFP